MYIYAYIHIYIYKNTKIHTHIYTYTYKNIIYTYSTINIFAVIFIVILSFNISLKKIISWRFSQTMFIFILKKRSYFV